MPPRKSPRRAPSRRTASKQIQIPQYDPNRVSSVRHQVDLAMLQRVMGEYSSQYDGQKLACVECVVVGPNSDVDLLRSMLTEKGLNPNLAVFVTIGKRPYGVYSFEDGYGTGS